MPYIASIHDQPYSIETGEHAAQRTVTINGATFAIDWRALASLVPDAKGHSASGGHFSLIINGASYDIYARRMQKPDEDGSRTYEVTLAGHRFEVQVEDAREKALSSAIQSGRETGEAKVRAPMPGLVIGVPLNIGDSVARDQTVIVLEAMKMENNLASPISGAIKEIKVNKGQTVNQGDVLVVISGD